MKYKSFFLLAFLTTGTILSQRNITGKSGIAYYKMNFYSRQINAELHFNQTESLFIYNKIGLDSLQRGNSMKINQNGKKIKGVALYLPRIDETGALIYRDFRYKKMILRYPNSNPLDPYIVQDKWNPWKWTIMDEYREILGYHAQKAIAQFRGRIYIAWFTREIPLPYGPWKLFGLPGLILEARDTEHVAVFTIEKICYPCMPGVIPEPVEKEEKTMKEHVHAQDYHAEMLEKKMDEMTKKINPETSVILADPTTLADIKEYREQHFEKIYEWEDFPGDTPNPFDENSEVQQLLDATPDKSILKEKGILPSDRLDNKGLETFPESIGIKE